MSSSLVVNPAASAPARGTCQDVDASLPAQAAVEGVRTIGSLNCLGGVGPFEAAAQDGDPTRTINTSSWPKVVEDPQPVAKIHHASKNQRPPPAA